MATVFFAAECENFVISVYFSYFGNFMELLSPKLGKNTTKCSKSNIPQSKKVRKTHVPLKNSNRD